MYLRKTTRWKDGKRHQYWVLVESYRTERGPRQRTVAWLGELSESGRLGMKAAAAGHPEQSGQLWDETTADWVEIDARRVRLERVLDFGGPWLGQQLLRKLKLDEFLAEQMPTGKEVVSWDVMAQVLVLCRLCCPCSELYMAEHYYERTGLADLLGIPVEKINEDRLYRALDALLPHKEALEKHLKQQAGELFALDYDLFLYDVTSTYFEGQCGKNPQARLGYSRDQRGDCKQVCIGLVVSSEGFPLGYEIFDGNRHDSQSVEQIVLTMEKRYGQANRIWVMDRGMVSEENCRFLQQGNRRYILGTPRSQLKRYERELLQTDWTQIRAGLEVRLVEGLGEEEVYILCRSQSRATKEKAMHARFEKAIEEGLEKIKNSCQTRRLSLGEVERRVGRLLGGNRRSAGLFQVKVETDPSGWTKLSWQKQERWRSWAQLSEGCYLLRSNIKAWSAEQLWKTYIQLTEAEEAFRIQKSDLRIPPVWHQRTDRVQAHILVCFLAYVLWKTLSGLCRQAGLGDEVRRVFDELGQIKLADVVLPTRQAGELRLRCVATPTPAQAFLLDKLKLHLPTRFPMRAAPENVVTTF